MKEPQEVIFEFYRAGSYVKVSAIDTDTMIEVAIVGDPVAGEETLKRVALNKLRYRLSRLSEGQAQDQAQHQTAKGLVA